MLFAKWFVVIQPSPFFTAFQIQAHKEAEASPAVKGERKSIYAEYAARYQKADTQTHPFTLTANLQ